MYNMESMDKHDIKLMGVVTVGPKGQVVVPAEVREQMGIKPGDKLVALFVPSKSSVAFVTEHHMQHLIDRMDGYVSEVRSALTKEKL